MTTYNGGAAVGFGYYFNRSTWEVVVMSSGGGILPGARDSRFLRIPVAAFFALAPVLGGLYVIFLPVIGFALVLQHLGRVTARAFGSMSASVMSAIAPAWLPGHAYFADKARRHRKAAGGERIEDERKPDDRR